MSGELPPKRESVLSNPQIIASIIGGIVTLLVAIVGVVPQLLNRPVTPTPIIVTATPIVTNTTAPTNTPAPLATPTSAPTLYVLDTVVPTGIQTAALPTPLPVVPTQAAALPTTPSGNTLLMYDGVSFTVLNQSGGTLSLEGVSFQSSAGSWDARLWGPSLYNSLPNNRCLRLRDATAGNRQPPAACGSQIYGLQLVGTTALFWVGVDTFEVARNGAVIATCRVSDGSCLISL